MTDQAFPFSVNDLLTDRAIVDAVEHAIIATTPDDRIFLWNKGAESLYGWTEREAVGRSKAELLVPVEGGRAPYQLATPAVEGDSPGELDTVVIRRDGEPLLVHAVERPILNSEGGVIAQVHVSEDVTSQRLVQQESADLARRLSLALDAGGLGTWRWDMATGRVEWDTRLEQLFGLEPGEFPGTFDAYRALLHPDDVPLALKVIEHAVEEKISYLVEHRVVWKDGSVRWIQGKGTVTLDAAGNVTGTIGCASDVTEQVLLRAERQEATDLALDAARREREARERLEFLSLINEALANSVTREQVMRSVTRVAVPRLGDWSAIFVLPNDDAVIPEVEIAHVDPVMVSNAKRLQERFPYDPDAPTGVASVIRSGRSEFYPDITDELLETLPLDIREVVRSLGVRSAIAVPLLKRHRVVGAMQFVSSTPGRVYTADDVALAEAVGARIASSLVNIRLSEHQRMIASTLQAGLLPDKLPDIPGVEIAVRYWAAGEGTDVGGDFYDVFEVEDHYALVIGDVCGTGPIAASITGLARHTIRAAAWQGADLTGVLDHLNHAMLKSSQSTFGTVLYSTLRLNGEEVRFDMVSGGHPLPIVRRSTGETEILGQPGPLLGVFADLTWSGQSTTIGPGDVLVLYTDGITDVYPPHDLSDAELQDMVEKSASETNSAQEVADQLGNQVSRVLPIADRKDDIAVLVLRVMPRN